MDFAPHTVRLQMSNEGKLGKGDGALGRCGDVFYRPREGAARRYALDIGRDENDFLETLQTEADVRDRKRLEAWLGEGNSVVPFTLDMWETVVLYAFERTSPRWGDLVEWKHQYTSYPIPVKMFREPGSMGFGKLTLGYDVHTCGWLAEHVGMGRSSFPQPVAPYYWSPHSVNVNIQAVADQILSTLHVEADLEGCENVVVATLPAPNDAQWELAFCGGITNMWMTDVDEVREWVELAVPFTLGTRTPFLHFPQHRLNHLVYLSHTQGAWGPTGPTPLGVAGPTGSTG